MSIENALTIERSVPLHVSGVTSWKAHRELSDLFEVVWLAQEAESRRCSRSRLIVAAASVRGVFSKWAGGIAN